MKENWKLPSWPRLTIQQRVGHVLTDNVFHHGDWKQHAVVWRWFANDTHRWKTNKYFESWEGRSHFTIMFCLSALKLSFLLDGMSHGDAKLIRNQKSTQTARYRDKHNACTTMMPSFLHLSNSIINLKLINLGFSKASGSVWYTLATWIRPLFKPHLREVNLVKRPFRYGRKLTACGWSPWKAPPLLN